MTAEKDVPSARQADMLSWIAATGETGCGMLGSDLRTYKSLLRRGWVERRPVERGFGLGPGEVAVATAAGRAALARATSPGTS